MDNVGLQILTKKHGQNMFTMDGAFVFRQLLKDHAYYGYLDDSWYGNDKLCVHYMPSVNFITSDMADKNVAVGFTFELDVHYVDSYNNVREQLQAAIDIFNKNNICHAGLDGSRLFLLVPFTMEWLENVNYGYIKELFDGADIETAREKLIELAVEPYCTFVDNALNRLEQSIILAIKQHNIERD